MKKFNSEQHEAYQSDVNTQMEEFFANASEEDRKKREAIGKATKILTDANVCFVGHFCQKHYLSPDRELFVQYNNIWDMAHRMYSKEENRLKFFAYVNCLRASAFVGEIGKWFDNKHPEKNPEETHPLDKLLFWANIHCRLFAEVTKDMDEVSE